MQYSRRAQLVFEGMASRWEEGWLLRPLEEVDFPRRFLDRPAPAVVLSEEKEGGRGDAAHRGV